MPIKKTVKSKPSPMNSKMKRIARQEAKKVINKEVETKIHDTSNSSQAVDASTGIVISLTANIARGTGEGDYLGDSITPVGAVIRLQYHRYDASQMFRFVLLQNVAGGVPLISTLFASSGNITTPLSPYDIDYQDTYRVLYDKLVSMDSLRNNEGVLTLRVNQKQLRKIYFNDAGGTVEKAGLYLCVVSDSTVATHPSIDYRIRLYYKDA